MLNSTPIAALDAGFANPSFLLGKRFFKMFIALATFLFFLGNVSQSQILTFDFAGLAGSEATASSNTNNVNLTASTISRGAGLTAGANADRFNASSWAITSIANAVTGNDYMEFTITPNSGYQFSVSSVVIQLQRSATGLTQVALRNSLDSYGADLDAAKTVTDNTTTQTFTFTFAQSNSSTAVTYRLYGFAEAVGGTGGPGDGVGNDITVNGAVTPTVVNYNVLYNGNTNTGGTAPVDPSSPYVSGSNVTVLGAGTLVKNGYTFSGWNTAANGSGTAYSAGGTITGIAANTTLYAQWTINTYALTYDGNGNDGGSAPVDPSSPYNYNSNVTVLNEGTLTKTGFSFNGWNTAANGSGTAYAAGGTITGIAAAVTLFAQWIPANSYGVIYDGNGNTGGIAPVDPSSPYASGSNVTVLSEGSLVRTGFTFAGWNTAANGSGTAYSSGGTISNILASVTLYAQWTINTYTVTYDGNGSDGGSVPVDPSSPYNYNSNVTVLGAGTLTRTNYNFTGWNTAANGSGTAYAAGGTITGLAANTTLFAQWSPVTYTVTYNGNTNTGGTAPVDPSSPYAFGSSPTVLGPGSLVKTGYSFNGWNTTADGSGTPYIQGNMIPSIAANTVLFAQWQINTYTVTYNANGNTGGTAPVDPSSPYNFGSVVTVLTNSGSLTKTGATFSGWNTLASGLGTDYAATGAATLTLGAANVVLYAKWQEPLYESFSYTAGDNIGGNTAASGTNNNNWTTHSNSQTGTIAVTAGSLSYTGLKAPTGNKVRLPGSNATTPRDVNRAIAVGTSSVAYYSFLLNVADATQLGVGGDYFTGIGGTAGTSVTILYSRLNIKSVNAAANYRLAINNVSTGGTPTFTDFATDLNFGTTYLVVIKYDLNGANPDIASLWVNPASLGGAEPGGNVTNSSGTANQTTFASIFFRNTAATPKADIDEVRVGTTWAEVTPTDNFTITATAQTTGGSISPSGAVSVSSGSNQAFTITTDPCNDIADVIVDGATSVLGDLVGNTYTFTNVTADHTIDVYFNPSTSTTWTGAVNTDWDNAGNWTSCVPNATLDVIIPVASPQPVLNVDAEVNSLTIDNAASLSLNGKTLTINGGLTSSATAAIIGSDASNLVMNSTNTIISSGAIRLHNLTINGGTTTLGSAVEISGGTATVLPGELSVQAGSQLQSNGFLTIKSNAFGTGRVAAGDDAGNYVTGDVTVERYIPANTFRSWRLLSVPTFGSGQTIRQAWQEGVANPSPLQNNLPGFGTQITGTGALATAQANGFDNITQSAALLSWTGTAWAGVPGTNTSITTAAGKKGLFLYIRGERSQGVTNSSSSPTATTLRTTGQLYQGTQAIPGFSANSFNLVGNLYASAIDFTQLNRTGGVSNLFYVWDSKKLVGSSLGTYQTFSGTNSFQCLIGGGSYTLGQPNTKIESGQAFFVQTGASAGTITLNEGSKVGNGANLGFRPVNPASLVKIDTRLYAANSAEIADANVVVFDNRYSNEVAEEDAIKLANGTENFGIQKGEKIIAIEGRKMIANTETISFNMSNLKQQEYTLEIAPQNMATQGLEATLEDSYLKTSTAISMENATTVKFTVDANAASKSANRFTIAFKKAVVLPVVDVKPAFVISPNPVEGGVVNLQFKNQPAGNYVVRIVSNNGQAVASSKIAHAGGTATQLLNLPAQLTAGMYQVEIIAANKTIITQSLLVK
ncbi:MAG: InlB B-repeat-containing protein [Chitinophagaceae bacterium]|nr:InlB B-repeat-containing protein [Chitinophagaceae bacterium]